MVHELFDWVGIPEMPKLPIRLPCPQGDTSPEFRESSSISHGDVPAPAEEEALPESNATRAWLPFILAPG